MTKLLLTMIFSLVGVCGLAGEVKLKASQVNFKVIDGVGQNNAIGIYQDDSLLYTIDWKSHKNKGFGRQLRHTWVVARYVRHYSLLKDLAQDGGDLLVINTDNFLIDLVSVDTGKLYKVDVVER